MAVGGHGSVPEATYLPEAKFVRLSEHLLWGGSWTCSFFYVILSGDRQGHAHRLRPLVRAARAPSLGRLGLESRRFIEHHLKELRRDWAVTGGRSRRSDAHTRRPRLRDPASAASLRHALRRPGRGRPGLGRPRSLGLDAVHVLQADQDRPRASGRRPLRLGAVHVRGAARAGTDGIPLGPCQPTSTDRGSPSPATTTSSTRCSGVRTSRPSPSRRPCFETAFSWRCIGNASR